MAEVIKVWKRVLFHLGKRRKPLTAGELAEELDLTYAAALSWLRRMKGRGFVRLAAFRNPSGDGAGRRAHVFEITEKGKEKVKYERAK
jgi:predicted ArsR family transcriptional regulator